MPVTVDSSMGNEVRALMAAFREVASQVCIMWQAAKGGACKQTVICKGRQQ